MVRVTKHNLQRTFAEPQALKPGQSSRNLQRGGLHNKDLLGPELVHKLRAGVYENVDYAIGKHFSKYKTNWNKLAASSLLQISASMSGGSHIVKMGLCIFSPIAQAKQCTDSSRTPANEVMPSK
jgi:hypothetical protein